MAEIKIYKMPFCLWAKQLLVKQGVSYTEIDVMMKPGKRREMIERAGGNRKVPQIFVDGRHIGDCENIQGLEGAGELDARLGIGE